MGHQRGAGGHQVARKEHVGRPRACSKNNISMINVFTLTNINTKIAESKLSKLFISEVCMKLAALRINRYTRSALSFRKVGDPLSKYWHLQTLHFSPGTWKQSNGQSSRSVSVRD